MTELGKAPEPLQIIGGRYRVECRLASAVDTCVAGAVDCATGKRVALKCWEGPTSEQEVAALQCFVRSANVTGLFENPHVVEVFGTELGDTISYSVTEWLEGSTLARELARVGRLSVREALQHVLPCMRAVVEAHAVGVIHGDIRPAHIFLCRAKRYLPERARVFDFGRGSPGFHELRLPMRAVVDEFCRYTPPELLSDVTLDARSDVYGFGLLLYEAITGERIFVADDLFDLLRAIEAGPTRAIADVTQTLPRGLVEVLYRAMAVDPNDRYQELSSLLDALVPFVSRSEKVTEPAANVTADRPASRLTIGVPRGRSVALVGTLLAASYLAFDWFASDESTERVTSQHAAVHASPPSPPAATTPEPHHDLVIADPVQVLDPARMPDAHSHVQSATPSPRRPRGRSQRQREQAVSEPPAQEAVAPVEAITNPASIERMELQ